MATVYKIELCSHWVNYPPEEIKKVLEKALKDKRELKFKGRPLRVSRAVEPKRREKKQQRKEAKQNERRE